MSLKPNIPFGSLLVEVSLASNVRQQVLFSGAIQDLRLKDIGLFKTLREDNTTGPVDFMASDIHILTVVDEDKYDKKSLIGMNPYEVTMKSGQVLTVHCFRIKRAEWIVGMLEDDSGLHKVFVNFEAVSQIKKLAAAHPFEPTENQPGPEDDGDEPITGKISEALLDSPFTPQEPTRFDLAPGKAPEDARFSAIMKYVKEHGFIDYKTLCVILNIPAAKLRSKIKLGDLLVQEGLLSPENLENALAFKENNRGLLFGEILLELGYLSELALALTLAVQFRLPFTTISPEQVDREAADLFSGKQAFEHEAIPYKLDNNQLVIAVANPGLDDIRELSFILNKNISLVVSRRQDVWQTITKIYGKQNAIEARTEKTHDLYFDEAVNHAESVDTIVAKGKKAPIVALVNQIIIDGVNSKASDIHITPEKDFVGLGYRVNGIIYKKTNLNKNVQNYVVARIKILGGMNVIERRLPQDGRIHGRALEQTVDIRVSILPAQHGETVVLRLRYPDQQLPALADLGFTKEHLALVRKSLLRSKGMILVTGPTGSGKSTTLTSFLKALLDLPEKLHIITAEDPVELEVPGLTQVPVNTAIGMSFPRILRNILRHDPDVVMVGEIRDLETARVAVQAALTGHLVFSTLHTNDAISTLTRLEDMGIESFLVGTAVNLVLAQRLVKTLCSCAEPYPPDSDDLELLAGFGFKLAAKQSLRRPKGCPKCDQSGYRGRAMIYELLLLDGDYRAMNLKEASQTGELRKTMENKGFVSLIKHGLSQVVAGKVYLPEIMQHWEG